MLKYASSLKWTSSEEKTEEKREAGRPKKAPTHPIRILAVGCSGTGKSTIGNLLLKDHISGLFHAAGSPESVTQEAQTEQNGRFVYTDVPGIPDTNMSKTKQFYNIIVEEAKKPVNVILFVFAYERIDVKKFKTCKLLFRELTRSKAEKYLIINDKRSRGFGGVQIDEKTWARDMQKLSEEISAVTDIEFDLVVPVHCDDIKKKMQKLKVTMEKYPPAKDNAHLRTFEGLLTYMEEMEGKEARLEDVVADARRDIGILKERVEYCEEMMKWAEAGSYYTSIISTTWATSIEDWGSRHKNMAASFKAQIKRAEATIEKGSQFQEDMLARVEQALEEFEELAKFFDSLDKEQVDKEQEAS